MSVLMAVVIAILLTISLYLVNHSAGVTNQVINLRTPCTLHSIKLLNGINESLAALRGYIIIGNQKFVTKRNEAWSKDIKESLENLKGLDECWKNSDNKILLDSSSLQLERLEKYQQEIEDIAHKPENIVAGQLLTEEFNPLSETMFTGITALINTEGTLEASAKRKSLLMMMADVRGNQGMAVANIRTYTITGNAEYLKTFRNHWEISKKRYDDISQNLSLLNVAQLENYRSLGRNACTGRRNETKYGRACSNTGRNAAKRKKLPAAACLNAGKNQRVAERIIITV